MRATLLLLLLAPLLAQPPAQLTPEQVIEKAMPSVGLVLVGQTEGDTLSSVGSAVVIRENGILLTAYHVVKNAYSLQIRFKNGETFDDVKLLWMRGVMLLP